MCRDPEIDAVFVGTPNQLHVPVALEAVRNGKHVLVTKPLADREEAAAELVQTAEAAGVVNMMSLNHRFSESSLYLQAQARAGVFGEIYYARARSVRRNGIPAWNLGFIQEGGGAFRDMGVHMLDNSWAIMGRPKPVSVSGVCGAKFGPFGRGYSDPTPEETWRQYAADDYAGGLIRFENGAALQVESFWASNQPPEIQIEIFGDKAGAQAFPPIIYSTEDGVEKDLAVRLSTRGEKAWENVAAHFIECVLDGAPCQSPLRDGLKVQQMLEAMLRSGALKREVAIEDKY
ncbi:MAG: putative oxidoreductase YcjS [candidate division BRC1 bacterium ADurb.BinA364]|nr:MAG: putative oxidoreductase YcjS [candidate division BRC1 bacterium ADurb.BinA364]